MAYISTGDVGETETRAIRKRELREGIWERQL